MAIIRRIISSRVVRWGFLAAVVAYAIYYIAVEWREIHHALDQIGPWASLASFVFVLAALFASMLVWRTLLAGLGSPLSLRAASRVLFIGQLGKYLPGSVWPVLAQIELATEHKVPRGRTAAASLINMAVTMLAGLLVGLIALPFTGGVDHYWWVFLIAAPLVACLYPSVLNRLLRLGFKILRRPPLEQELTGRVILKSLGWSVVCWFFYGVQIWILMLKTGASPARALPLAVGSFAFAFVVGFVIILAPAGAGFRDVLIAAFLAPMIGTGPATAVALVSRFATAAGDLVTAGLAAASYKRGKQAPPVSGSTAVGSTAAGKEERAADESTASPRPVP